MKIETLRNKYTFSKDDHSITLYKLVLNKDKDSKNHGLEMEVLVGHYNTVENIFKKLFHLELIDRGTINELIEDSFKVKESLDKLAAQLTW